MHYDWHNDMWIIDGMKTDYSITVFLSEPDDYEGGELEIEVGDATSTFKLEAGRAVIYHTGLRHKVHPVTKGERNVITWWFTSMIDNGKIRDTITEYSRLLSETPMEPEVKWKFETIRQNLIREHASF
jgi:PKHD-type hydroxylase